MFPNTSGRTTPDAYLLTRQNFCASDWDVNPTCAKPVSYQALTAGMPSQDHTPTGDAYPCGTFVASPASTLSPYAAEFSPASQHPASQVDWVTPVRTSGGTHPPILIPGYLNRYLAMKDPDAALNVMDAQLRAAQPRTAPPARGETTSAVRALQILPLTPAGDKTAWALMEHLNLMKQEEHSADTTREGMVHALVRQRGGSDVVMRADCHGVWNENFLQAVLDQTFRDWKRAPQTGLKIKADSERLRKIEEICVEHGYVPHRYDSTQTLLLKKEYTLARHRPCPNDTEPVRKAMTAMTAMSPP